VAGRRKGINGGMGIIDREEWEISLSMEATMGEGNRQKLSKGHRNFTAIRTNFLHIYC
jgi:hypothetical protein